MKETKRSILVVDDEEGMRELLDIVLEKRGFAVATAPNAETALELFRARRFDVVIQDIRMPGMGGIRLIEELRALDPAVPILVITAYSTWDSAVEAMRLGAFDYVRKPFVTDEILATISRALEHRRLCDEGLADPLLEKGGLIVGGDGAMREIFAFVKQIAPTDSTVLICGASGTGKELIARVIHCRSTRGAKPFVCVNCGAFPDTLLESELFGYRRGAFTGATEEKKGLLVVAHGGTIFLDEIAEMTPRTQVKLLRALEERKVLPLGGTEEVAFDARIIAATNRDMEAEVASGAFREDLYYRLNVIPIQLPPLRDRKEDIPLLAGHFLAKYSRRMHKNVRTLAPAAQEALARYDWPGNVRELENVIQRYVALTQGEVIERIDIGKGGEEADRPPPASAASENALPPEGVDLEALLNDYERSLLVTALKRTDGNMAQAAKILGLSYRSIRYKVKKLGIAVEA
jgi:two-component system response regulator PilR (NtrC family)